MVGKSGSRSFKQLVTLYPQAEGESRERRSSSQKASSAHLLPTLQEHRIFCLGSGATHSGRITQAK